MTIAKDVTHQAEPIRHTSPGPSQAHLLDLELTDFVDSWGSGVYGVHHDRINCGPAGPSPAGCPSARRGDDRERGNDLPLLRDQPANVLWMETTLRRAWVSGAQAAIAAPEFESERHG